VVLPLSRRPPRRQDAELVALRIGQHHPRNLTLPDIDTRRAEGDQSIDLCLLVIRTQVKVEAVLNHLGRFDGYEQDPRQPIDLWLDLEHRWAIIDHHPPQRLAPPATKCHRVMRSDDDLFPLETHGPTLTTPFTAPPGIDRRDPYPRPANYFSK